MLPKYRDCITSNDFELCMYIYNSKSLDVVQYLYFGSKQPSSYIYIPFHNLPTAISESALYKIFVALNESWMCSSILFLTKGFTNISLYYSTATDIIQYIHYIYMYVYINVYIQ